MPKVKLNPDEAVVKMIKEGLKVKPGTKIIPFSATSKQGREEIWELMDSYLQEEIE